MEVGAQMLMYIDEILSWLCSCNRRFFVGAVPSVYPINVFTSLSMVDRLESLGISRHFKFEIKQALDDVYR